MHTQRSCLTIREKMLAGYNLLWNENSNEVHLTGTSCHSSDHLDRIAPRHEHFFKGYYAWDGQKWQLYISAWDPMTAVSGTITYSNCGHCRPDSKARNAA